MPGQRLEEKEQERPRITRFMIQPVLLSLHHHPHLLHLLLLKHLRRRYRPTVPIVVVRSRHIRALAVLPDGSERAVLDRDSVAVLLRWGGEDSEGFGFADGIDEGTVALPEPKTRVRTGKEEKRGGGGGG